MSRIIDTNPTILRAEFGFVREPLRPIEWRIDGFREKFDASTLFYDAFFNEQQNQILLLGPPFLNLLSLVEAAVVRSLPSNARCDFRILSMDRHSQMWITVPFGTQEIVLESDLGRIELKPSANLAKLFAGKRVLLTLSRNNRFEWIQDWVKYNRDIHGANAILFYDNQSTAYSAEELLGALEKISGIDQICIVKWPFKYGPLGVDFIHYWDSNFCQHGSLEHARWMFLQQAHSTLNTDIDELVVSSNGQSVFKAAEQAWTGMVAFNGVWVYGLEGKTAPWDAELPVRVTAFDHYLKPTSRRYLGLLPITNMFPTPGGMLNTKWAISPRKYPANAQWAVHAIYGWRGMYTRMSTDSSFCYRHYREINDNWREMTADWQFDRWQRETYNPARFCYDHQMTKNFARVRWDT